MTLTETNQMVHNLVRANDFAAAGFVQILIDKIGESGAELRAMDDTGEVGLTLTMALKKNLLTVEEYKNIAVLYAYWCLWNSPNRSSNFLYSGALTTLWVEHEDLLLTIFGKTISLQDKTLFTGQSEVITHGTTYMKLAQTKSLDVFTFTTLPEFEVCGGVMYRLLDRMLIK